VGWAKRVRRRGFAEAGLRGFDVLRRQAEIEAESFLRRRDRLTEARETCDREKNHALVFGVEGRLSGFSVREPEARHD